MVKAFFFRLKILVEFQNRLYALLNVCLQKKMRTINLLQINGFEVVSKLNCALLWN